MFQFFDLQKSDYVAVYDGVNKDAQLIGKYCGYLRPPPIISSQRALFVEFKSDSSIQSTGFLANVGTTSLGPASLRNESKPTLKITVAT